MSERASVGDEDGGGDRLVPRCLAGIFVGGASSRMGGFPKGLLEIEKGVTLLARWQLLLDGLQVPWVVLGTALYQGQDAYAVDDGRVVHDSPRGIGPLGGLRALCLYAAERSTPRVLALACDLPFVRPELVRALACHPGGAAVVSPWWGGTWQPLCARYEVSAVLPAIEESLQAGDYSLQRVLQRAGATRVAYDAGPRELLDWDGPEDLA